METPPHTSPDACTIAQTHADEILAAASSFTAEPAAELRLLAHESFESDAEAGTYGFLVMSDSGMIGVSAKLNAQRKLEGFSCTRV